MKPNPISPGVVWPVSVAWDRMVLLLFRPMDPARWLAIGFTAWLAGLGEFSGGTAGSKDSGNWGRNLDLRGAVESAWEWAQPQLLWLVPTLVVGVFLVLALYLLMLWVSSRGEFMFLHNVVTGRDDVVAPWNAYGRHGDNLFLFRVVLFLGVGAVALPLAVAAVWGGWQLLGQPDQVAVPLATLIVSAVLLVSLGLGMALVLKLTRDFVVPIMQLRTPSARAAWRELLPLLAARPGAFVVYLLFQLVLWFIVAILLLALILVTCCVAGCLLALPFVGTVLMLPVLVFFRSYSLLFLSGFGRDWDVFQPAAGTVPEPAGPTAGGM